MSIESTLAERGNRYGDFTDHARLCQDLKDVMTTFAVVQNTPNSVAVHFPWGELPATHKQALEVIADKIARILSGDPNYADNWHDIQGYAKLVEDRLPQPAGEAALPADTGCPHCGARELHQLTCPTQPVITVNLGTSLSPPNDPASWEISDEAAPSKPAPDPYDWYTWKPGDLLVCEQRYSEGRGEPAINVGDFVRVLKVEDRDCVDDLPVHVNHDVLGDIWPDHEDYDAKGDDKPLRRIFRFHSRPTK